MVYVRVHRGPSNGDINASEAGWRSLNSHLSVRDTREDDPEAELMVSVMVPTLTFVMTNSKTEVQLRPRESVEMLNAPKNLIKRLGGALSKVFYKAPLSDTDRTAILNPEEEAKAAPSHGIRVPPPLACPKKGVSGTPHQDPSATPSHEKWSSGPGSAILHRLVHGDSVVDRSVELLNQATRGKQVRLAYRITLVMANDHARELVAGTEGAPDVSKPRDPCAVRVKLAEGLSLTTHVPFPTANPGAMKIKMSRRQGYVHLTVPLLRGPLQVPFSLTTYAVESGRRRSLSLPSTVFWPPCAPLASLPRLDLKAEWAHDKVGGPSLVLEQTVLAVDRVSTVSTVLSGVLLIVGGGV